MMSLDDHVGRPWTPRGISDERRGPRVKRPGWSGWWVYDDRLGLVPDGDVWPVTPGPRVRTCAQGHPGPWGDGDRCLPCRREQRRATG